MRNLSVSALAKIAQKQGTEPINIIAIQWAIGGPVVLYADRDILEHNIQGRILELDSIDDVVKVSQNQSSAEVTLKLDDTDLLLRQIINTTDIHFRDVIIYQWFSGLDITDMFVLFQGKINSPITYSDGDRTLTFTVLSTLESTEIGFQPEEGQNFNFISDEYFDEPWPLVFGTVNHLPGQLVYKIPQGQTTKPLSMPNTCRSSVLNGIAQAGIERLNILAQMQAKFAEGELRLNQYLEQRHTDKEENAFRESIQEANREASNQGNDRLRELDRQMLLVQIQAANEETEPDYGTEVGHVINGHKFPQNQIVTIKINDAFFTGRFSGDNFYTTSVENPNGDCVEAAASFKATEYVAYMQYNPDNTFDGLVLSTKYQLEPYSVPNNITNTYWFADGGATVELVSGAREAYVVNILPSSVLGVYARKGAAGIETLQVVPRNYYSVKYYTLNDKFTATVVELHRALSSYDEGWTDGQIYATVQSPIGPNTSDILKWLIQIYSNYGVDVTSFNSVRTDIQHYPSHFALFDRKELFTALEEIAWQARCRIWLNGNTFYLSYLSNEPAPVTTITDTDIAMESLVLTHTDSESIVTKMRAEWYKDYSQDEPNVVTLRYNTAKYGVHEETYDFYIYNMVDLVIKSAQFWIVRLGNTWKEVTFTTYLHKLNVETFDCVTFDLPGYYATGAVKALVDEAIFDSSDFKIQMKLWLPVRSGTMTPYVFVWPADISVELFWPRPDEVYAAPVSPGTTADGSEFGLPNSDNNTSGGVTVTFPSDNRETTTPVLNFDNDNTPTENVEVPIARGSQLYMDVVPETIKYNPPDPKLSSIDIRTTRITDSANDTVGLLSTVLQVVDKPSGGADGIGSVALATFALVSDGDNHETMSFEYDGENKFFRPSTSFFLDDPEAEVAERDAFVTQNEKDNKPEDEEEVEP